MRDYVMTLQTLSGRIICPVRVGDILVTETATNPSNTYTGTTWQQVCVGRVPVGVNASETEFNAVNKQGGEKAHKLTVDEMPGHTHLTGHSFDSSKGTNAPINGQMQRMLYNPGNGYGTTTKSTGNGASHNNLQPYETKYFWKRLT